MDQSTENNILRLYQDGMSYSQIRRLLKVGNERISNVVQFAATHGTAPAPKTRGRPRVVNSILVNKIDVISIHDAKLSDSQIALQLRETDHITVSRSSVNRAHHLLNYKWRPPKKIQALTDLQVQKRLDFCNSILNDPHVDFTKIIFSDESRFTQTSDSRWIWARKGITSDSQFTEVQGYPRGIMIWGAIGVGFKSRLVIVDGMIDAEKYLSVIHDSNLIMDANLHYGLRQYTFM